MKSTIKDTNQKEKLIKKERSDLLMDTYILYDPTLLMKDKYESLSKTNFNLRLQNNCSTLLLIPSIEVLNYLKLETSITSTYTLLNSIEDFTNILRPSYNKQGSYAILETTFIESMHKLLDTMSPDLLNAKQHNFQIQLLDASNLLFTEGIISKNSTSNPNTPKQQLEVNLNTDSQKKQVTVYKNILNNAKLLKENEDYILFDPTFKEEISIDFTQEFCDKLYKSKTFSSAKGDLSDNPNARESLATYLLYLEECIVALNLERSKDYFISSDILSYSVEYEFLESRNLYLELPIFLGLVNECEKIKYNTKIEIQSLFTYIQLLLSVQNDMDDRWDTISGYVGTPIFLDHSDLPFDTRKFKCISTEINKVTPRGVLNFPQTDYQLENNYIKLPLSPLKYLSQLNTPNNEKLTIETSRLANQKITKVLSTLNECKQGNKTAIILYSEESPQELEMLKESLLQEGISFYLTNNTLAHEGHYNEAQLIANSGKLINIYDYPNIAFIIKNTDLATIELFKQYAELRGREVKLLMLNPFKTALIRDYSLIFPNTHINLFLSSTDNFWKELPNEELKVLRTHLANTNQTDTKIYLDNYVRDQARTIQKECRLNRSLHSHLALELACYLKIIYINIPNSKRTPEIPTNTKVVNDQFETRRYMSAIQNYSSHNLGNLLVSISQLRKLYSIKTNRVTPKSDRELFAEFVKLFNDWSNNNIQTVENNLTK